MHENNFNYSQVANLSKSNKSEISGFGIIIGAQIGHLPDDTLMVNRPIIINKKIEIKTRHNNGEHP